MNYIKQLNWYWEVAEYVGFGAVETALYVALLHHANNYGSWENPISIKTKHLLALLGIKDIRTGKQAFERLERFGLLRMEAKGKTGVCVFDLYDVDAEAWGSGESCTKAQPSTLIEILKNEGEVVSNKINASAKNAERVNTDTQKMRNEVDSLSKKCGTDEVGSAKNAELENTDAQKMRNGSAKNAERSDSVYLNKKINIKLYRDGNIDDVVVKEDELVDKLLMQYKQMEHLSKTYGFSEMELRRIAEMFVVENSGDKLQQGFTENLRYFLNWVSTRWERLLKILRKETKRDGEHGTTARHGHGKVSVERRV